MKLSAILRERGYVHQHSASLEEITDGPKRTLYLGIDPSADSLHVGHLQVMLLLRRFLDYSHDVILVIGGGTGLIGDPSGKSEERPLLDEQEVARNADAIGTQAKTLFAEKNFRLVNNADWLMKLNLVTFLRDIGKYFSVNAMIRRDSVRERLRSPGEGISYTEFSYMLLQAYDFLHLNREFGCDVQVGASDQWGNIVAGIDLIRRKTGVLAYGLTAPLLVDRSSGKKFGKSEGGTVWLDAQKTSPFEFYQFWFNTTDADVEDYLLKMTLLPKADIDAVMAEQKTSPSTRAAQKKLAWEVTALVHGQAEADKAQDFKNVPSVPTGKLRDIAGDLGVSISELRRLVAQGAVELNGTPLDSIESELNPGMLRIGRQRFFNVVRT